MTARQLVPYEHTEQAALISWCEVNRARHPELGMLFAIPNGEHRHRLTALKLKAQGVKPGVPDLYLAVPRWGYHGLFIEMKRRKGGSTSEAQQQWIKRLVAHGYSVQVCKGWESARDALQKYLCIP